MNLTKYLICCNNSSFTFPFRFNIIENFKSKEKLNLTFSIHDQLSEIELFWNKLDQVENSNKWLTFEFQKVIQKANPETIQVKYGSLELNNKLVAFFPIYFFDFKLNESLKQKNFFKRFFGNFIQGKVLCMGQLFSTEGNFPFVENLSNNNFSKELHDFLFELAVNNKAKVILWKDFFEEIPNFPKNGYFPFKFQPTLIMDIHPGWKSFKDYENNLFSKYRTRLNRARKKIVDVKWLVLDEFQIKFWEDHLYKLYLKVAKGANFNFGILPKSYFMALKNAFKEDFIITAGFLNNELICFYSTLRNKNSLEVNLAGFEEHLNIEKQLYLNMLFKMVEDGIDKKVKKINFYRTATEIKCSVGAKSNPTWIYLKPTSKWLAPLFPIFVPWFSPTSPVHKDRNPFKLLENE